ncbi:hypothetical protein BDA96_07G006300 [Sorghum bicolor]|uniref:F-box domain-containing protein n=2 Tax=Sorghum bicolor TaxID=4558 RepID=A0A921U8A4_SORBI|nr:hypothetical protein BDA96_07G006300 [Sorghum bicolor]KXG24188.2 hypothetical protein SORBI_3007G005900 [Sorghum bicolor]
MASSTMAASASSVLPPPTTSPSWSQLLPELLGRVIAHLPFPADHARFRAVCRAWRTAAHDQVRLQLPWLVLPDGSFCITSDDDDNGCGGVFFDRLPGLPDAAVTCTVVVGSTDDWLALDCTCDEDHLKYVMGNICSCCLLDKDDDDDVKLKRKPSYLLHNAFSGATVPLPELEAVISSVSRRFQIRKVLMRSSTPDDVIAVVTNSWDYNIILCRPGKGTHVLYYYDIFDVAFLGDWLYGITPNENLVGFRLGEDDDDDGNPVVATTRRFITNPLPQGEEDYWSWIDEQENSDDDDDDDGGGGSHGGNDDDGNDNEDEDAERDQEDEDDKVDDQSQNKEEDEGEGEADDEAQDTEEEEEGCSCSSGDGMIPNGVDVVQDEGSSLNEPKDYIVTIRKLVKSRAGELLMVKRQMQAPSSYSGPPHTRKVDIFKADINAGKWLPVTGNDCLAEDEALFLSKSFSKSVRVHGDIRARFVYFDDTLEAFDTTSSTCIPSSLGDQVYRLLRCSWLTWIFPQELVV